MPLASRMLRARSLSSTLSDCQLPSVPPMNTDPLIMLPPSFRMLLSRMPPPDVSAGIAAVITEISDWSMSSK